MRSLAPIVAALAIALAAGSVAGCSGPEYLPENDPGETGPTAESIHDKAKRWHGELHARHISPDGLLLYRVDTRRPAVLAGAPSYEDFADQTIWGGCLLAAESLRYAVTRDPQALADAKKVFAGMRLLLAVTGEPGLAARSAAPAAAVEADPGADGKWRPAKAPNERMVYRGDVSKDQYTGLLFGYAAALEHLAPHDEEVRAGLAEDLAAIADRLWRDEMYLVEDGEVTTFGNCRGRIFGFPIAVNALVCLSAFRLAAEATGDARHWARYRELAIDDGYAEIAYWSRIALPSFGLENHNNDNMAWLCAYALLRFERDPDIIRHVRAGMRRGWGDGLRAQRNPLLTFMFTGLIEDDDEALADAVEQLRRFGDAQLWVHPVDLRGREDIERAFWDNRKNVPRAARALDMDLRGASSFAWKSCPFQLYDDLGAEPDRIRYSATDYLLTYWLARRHGLIPAPE